LYFPIVIYRKLDPLSSLAQCERFSSALRIAAQTPFTARLGAREYMVDVLAGVEGNPAPLAEDPAQAASDFLMRLAKRGLIAFLPEGKALELDPGEDLPCADK
jgi:hypothetical protein